MYVSVCICMYLYVAARICMYWHVYHWNCLNNILVLLTHHHGHKDACYPLGVCDRQGSPGSGSPLFYINSWAMIWPVDYNKDGCWYLSIKHSFFVSERKVSLCALVDLLSTAVQLHSVIQLNSLSTVVYCPNTCKYMHIHTNTDHTHSCPFTPATCC